MGPEDLDLVDEVAGAALGVDARRVEVPAEVVEAGCWVGMEVRDDHQDGAGHGDEASRRLRSPKKVSLLAAEAAAYPRTRFRYGLPLPVLAERLPVPDWTVRGTAWTTTPDGWPLETGSCPGRPRR